jgi:hypothetical protein
MDFGQLYGVVSDIFVCSSERLSGPVSCRNTLYLITSSALWCETCRLSRVCRQPDRFV